MKLITYKNNLITYEDFLKKAINTEYIDGIIIPIMMTKDKKIIIFNDQISDINQREFIQKNTLQDLENNIIIKLDDFLNKLSFFKKRIILKIYPLYQVILNNENIQYFNELNKEYILEINNILTKYSFLNISLCSFNQILIEYIKNLITDIPIGLIILQEDLKYIDVNFYILATNMLDAIIIEQELSLGKEVMINAFSNSDLFLIKDYFFNKKNNIKNNIWHKLTFISTYPELFYELFSNEN